MPKRITFRTDASGDLGFGHLRRCLALAEFLAARGHRIDFLISDLSADSAKQDIEASSYSFTQIAGRGRPLAEIEALDSAQVDHCDVMIADIAHKGTLAQRVHLPGYLRSLHRRSAQLVVIEGLGGDSIAQACDGIVDLLITPYAYDPATTALAKRSRQLIGAEYAVLGAAFSQAKTEQRAISKAANKILVTTGGADPCGVVLRLLSAISKIEDPDLRIHIVVGPLFSPTLRAAITECTEESAHRISLIESARSLMQEMLWCDLAIATSGLSKYELAATGTPAILLSHDAIHARNNQAFKALATSIDLGEVSKLSDAAIADAIVTTLADFDERAQMAERGRQAIDGAGAERIADAIEALAP